MRPWSRAGVRWVITALSAFCPVAVFCQTADQAQQQAEILEQLSRLSVSLEKTQQQLSESQAEIRQLRAKIDAMESRQETSLDANSATAEPAVTQESEGAAPLIGPAKASISQDDWEVMNERVAELQQTKVESASKFRVKLSGLVLATALTSTGQQ